MLRIFQCPLVLFTRTIHVNTVFFKEGNTKAVFIGCLFIDAGIAFAEAQHFQNRSSTQSMSSIELHFINCCFLTNAAFRNRPVTGTHIGIYAKGCSFSKRIFDHDFEPTQYSIEDVTFLCETAIEHKRAENAKYMRRD
jgi:hypothetical protein